MKKKKIYIIGSGGHAKTCIDVIQSNKKYIISCLVDKDTYMNKKVFEYKVENEKKFLKKNLKNINIVVGVGQIKNSSIRKKIYNLYKNLGCNFPNIISKFSYVSEKSILSDSTLIGHGAVINSFSKIGSNCIINNQSLVEHDVKIGNHCHISTGAIINGGTQIGSNTFIWSGTIIKEGIKIGNNCVIGLGLNIKKNINSNTILKK